MRSSALRELARSFLIEPSYTDASGTKRNASREALVAAIEARAGVSIDEAAVLRREPPVLEPVCVVWGSDRTIDVELPGGTMVEWDLELEDGSWRSGRCDALGGTIALDQPLPPGYHTLRIGDHEALVIAAPRKAQAPRGRTWGVFAPLYAAHTRRSWGIGDLGDLLAYAGWIDRFGGGIVATLPMLASFDGEPSPYSPVSRLFWNEAYLDVTRLPEFRESDGDAGTIAHLRQSPSVDYEGVRREKRRVLELCAERFTGHSDFERFARGARDYAAFVAKHEQRDSEAYHLYVQFRMSQQMREVANAARRLGPGLYLDFPLGVHPDGYDAHRYSQVFAKNVSVGAPPDLFFTKGQNWGFPPFDPEALRADRYAYFRSAIRHHVSHAGILRIDHVMGLHRLYWIPEGMSARDGVYVRYHAEELYAILVLESQRHGCAIVGEDLGTVPPEVPRMMQRHGLRRMYVVQYEVKPGETPLGEPAAASVASVNTHDMPTFASFWKGGDIEERVEQDLLDDRGAGQERATREKVRASLIDFLIARGHLPSGPTQVSQKVLAALLEYLAASDAEMMLVNLEDLWGETAPQNVPGIPQRSWRHRFRLGLEDAVADGEIRRIFERVAALRARDLLPENEGVGPDHSSRLEPARE